MTFFKKYTLLMFVLVGANSVIHPRTAPAGGETVTKGGETITRGVEPNQTPSTDTSDQTAKIVDKLPGKTKVDVQNRLKAGETLESILIKAAQRGPEQRPLFIELIHAGMDPNLTDSEGTTLLVIAAKNNRWTKVKYLLNQPLLNLDLNKQGEEARKIIEARPPLENTELYLARNKLKERLQQRYEPVVVQEPKTVFESSTATGETVTATGE